MAKMTVVFGVVLILLGVWGFYGTGAAHPTAWIPTYFGAALVVSGGLAITENAKRRMVWMHIAVTVGLLGFIGAAVQALREVAAAHGGPLAHPVAVEDQGVMAVVCLLFVALCVRSFIVARRGRKAE